MYWQQVPIGWREAPAVVALGAVVGGDPRLYLLDLWEWAWQHGFSHPTHTARLTYEAAAGWRGASGDLLAAMLKSGWLVEANGNLSIVEWQKHITARHIDGKPLDGMTKDQIAKAQAAARAKRYRDRKAMVNAASRTVTPRHAPSRTVTRDASRSTVTDTVTTTANSDENIYETSTNNTVTLASRSRHASRTEVEVEVDIRDKNLALFASAPSEDTQERAPRGRPPKDTPEIVTDREQWLEKARALVGLTPEESPPGKVFFVRFAQQRKKRGMEQLLRSLEGLEKDPWAKQQGLQPLLSDAVIEKGLARWNKGATGAHVSRVQHAVGTGDAFMRSMWGEE